MSNYRLEQENNRIQRNGMECFIQEFHAKGPCTNHHVHPAVEILYILRGDFRITSDNEEFFVHPGDLVLVRSYALHLIHALSESTGTYYVLKLTPAFLLDISSKDRGSGYLLSLALQNQSVKTIWTKEECRSSRIADSMERLMRESGSTTFGSDIAVKICAAEIVLTLLRDLDQENCRGSELASNEDLTRRIYDATVFINKHYADEITAQDCSRHVNLSYSYFSRNFRRLTGKTFSDYLNNVRISRAERELFSTEKSITDIATECGFNTVSYFISKFREKKGITPSVYREQSGGLL